MMPDVAAVVINKNLERPQKGMPAEWRKDFHMRQRGLKKAKAVLTQVIKKHGLVMAGVAATAVVGLVGGFLFQKFSGEEDYEEYEDEEEPWSLMDRFKGKIRWQKGGGR